MLLKIFFRNYPMLVNMKGCGLRADSVTETDQIDFQVPSASNRFGGFGHIWIENMIRLRRPWKLGAAPRGRSSTGTATRRRHQEVEERGW